MNTPFRFFLLVGLFWLRSITLSMAQGNDVVTTGCYFDPLSGNAKRVVNDLTVPGCVGEYPLKWSRTANSRRGPTRGDFGAGGPWLYSYDWYFDGELNFTCPDGRILPFSQEYCDENDVCGADVPGITERLEIVTRNDTDRSSGEYNLLLEDGGKVCFRRVAYGVNRYYTTVTKLIDPHGLETNVSFMTDGRPWKITEPGGRYLQINYAPTLIGSVQAYDGRGNVTQSVTYTYSIGPGPGHINYSYLTRVDYSDGTSATYTYYSGTDTHASCLKSCDDVRYPGPMGKIYYEYQLAGIDSAAGQLKYEKYSSTGPIVSQIAFPGDNVRVETRGDGPSRTFNYVPGPTGRDLVSYTDFKAQTSVISHYFGFSDSLTDARGNTTTFAKNTVGKVTQIQYPLTPNDTPPGTPQGTVISVFGSPSCPDPNNRGNLPYYLYSTTDEGGHTTVYTRDANKRVARIDYPDGAYETFTYNSFGEILTHRLRTGGVETFTYDGRGLKTEYRDPDHATGNPTARYIYDALDRVSDVTDALGSNLGDPAHTTSFTYNQRGQTLTTTKPIDPVDGQRHTITNVYNANGTLASTTDELNHTTSYTYDDYKRLKTTTTPLRFTGDTTPRTTYTYYDANGTGNDYTHTDANVTYLTLPGGEKTVTTYDENRRKTSVTVAYGTTSAAKTSFEYDSVGNVTGVISPKQQPGQPYAGQKTVTHYDERDRTYAVDDPPGRTTSCTYDAAGRKASTTDPNGQVVTYDSFDSMNRLLQQTVKQTPSPDAVTKYTYDPVSGLLATMQDPRLVANNSSYSYSYTYDNMGRKLTAAYPPDSGGLQRTEAWHYDPVSGRLDTFTNRAGNVQTTLYDPLNRITSVSWNDGGVTPTVTFGYDVASRKTSVVNSNATIAYSYLNDNLLTSETSTYADNTARTVNYTYNANAGRATIQYPNGAYSFTYNYTPRQQLQTLVNNSGGGTIATYVYDLNGNLSTRTPDNATSSSYTYDALDRTTHIGHAFAGANTRTFDYGYEPLTNNRKWAKRDNNLGDAFGYDLNDEVIDAKLNIASPDMATTGASIVYDANGNQTSFASFDPTNPKFGSTDTYATNDLNQYASRTASTTPAYDATGNTTTALDGSTYQYDAQNRLTSATKGGNTLTFKYDGLNRQVSRKLGTASDVYSVWDGWNVIEHIQDGSVTVAFLSGATGMIKNLLTGNYYYQDASGSTSHLASNTGQLLEWYRYDLQGAPLFYNSSNSQLSASAYGIKHLFTGQQWYITVGLYDLRNRFYSPDIGRFLQGDPIGFKGDATNLYRYCGNDWANKSDPLGTDPGDPFSSAVAAGVDAARFINPKSIAKNWEYGGLMYKQNGKYYATKARTDKSGDSVDFGNIRIPRNSQKVGNYHTHASYSVVGPTGRPVATGDPKRDDYNSEHFSKGAGKDLDVIHAAGAGKPEFTGVLITPSGKIRTLDGTKSSSTEKTLRMRKDASSEPAGGMSIGDYNWAMSSWKGLLGYSPVHAAEATNYGIGVGNAMSGISECFPCWTDFAWGNPNPDTAYPTGPVKSVMFGNHSWGR